MGLCYLNKLNLSQGLPGVLWKRGPGSAGWFRGWLRGWFSNTFPRNIHTTGLMNKLGYLRHLNTHWYINHIYFQPNDWAGLQIIYSFRCGNMYILKTTLFPRGVDTITFGWNWCTTKCTCDVWPYEVLLDFYVSMLLCLNHKFYNAYFGAQDTIWRGQGTSA